MTIKQQGGVFGRNPTFNDADISNDLSVGNDATVAGDLTVGGSGLIDNLKVVEDLELRMSKTAFGSNTGYGYIFKTGSGGSAPFDQSGALVYQPRQSTTDGRSNHKFYTGTPLALALDLKPNQNAHFGGNVVLASGAGIDFSATSGTGTSELFDDYEEGTWTPVFQGSTSGSKDLGAIGKYTKIGRMVHVAFYATNADFSSAAIVGTVELSGLPFNIAVTGQGLGNIAINNLITGGSDYVPYAYLTNRLRFSAGSTILLSDAGLTQSASRVVAIALTYEAA